MGNTNKPISRFVWSLIVILVVLVLGMIATQGHKYTGADIRFSTGQDIRIKADKVTVSAASPYPFLLKNEKNETIVGLPVEPPLGYGHDTYYKADPKEISGGAWEFASGSAFFAFENDKPFEVTTFESRSAEIWMIIIFIAVIVWIIGLIFVI